MVHKDYQMTTQTDKVKEDFAKRLHKGMDLIGYPVRGRARILSREFNISDKGAGKWLNGETIPETSKIPHLANFLKVNAEWLLTGKETTSVGNSVEIISNKNEEASMTVSKLNSLSIKIEKLVGTNDLNNDKLKIISDMIDGIDRIIDALRKFK
nr:hypothetical protein F987_00293 [Acinetobacter gyllenbergii NIPH 230]